MGHLSGGLLKVDRSSMFNSPEVRVPLLGREVIDAASTVDWKIRFDMATENSEVSSRSSLATYPNFQISAIKGLSPPMGQWLQTILLPILEDILLVTDNLLGFPLSLAFWEQHHGR